MMCCNSFYDYASFYWKIVVFIYVIEIVNSCEIKYPNGSIRCCYNHVEMNGACEECSPGYFGANCTSRCSSLSYGYLCTSTCDCSVQDCHNVHGCPNTTGSETYSTRHNGASTNYFFPQNAVTVNPVSTVKIKEIKGLNDEISDMHIRLLITITGTLICLFIILLIAYEICKYSRCLRLSTMNDASCGINGGDGIYTEINEITVGAASPEDYEITYSTERISNGHALLTATEEDRCEEYVYSTACKEKMSNRSNEEGKPKMTSQTNMIFGSTVCKEKILSNDEAIDDGNPKLTPKPSIPLEEEEGSRYKKPIVSSVNIENLFGHDSDKKQEPSFEISMKYATVNCVGVNEEYQCSDSNNLNDKNESSYL